jgi:hypothetical protein
VLGVADAGKTIFGMQVLCTGVREGNEMGIPIAASDDRKRRTVIDGVVAMDDSPSSRSIGPIARPPRWPI